jgi:hypothetical protein
LVIGGLFLWKRSRRSKVAEVETLIESDKYTVDSTTVPSTVPPYELHQIGPVKYEANGVPQAELHHEQRPVELAGDMLSNREHER